MDKRLRTTRRSIWPRPKHRVGRERPHFCTRFRAQSESWVAPARDTGSVTAFYSRAQRELSRKTSESIFSLATHCSRLDLNRREEGERLFSQKQKWLIT